ncbi:thioredoxin domain-containing protein 6-like [Polypterus senegalus]|uniref:thioredoxin domain-containing protein 6-like n=1 Tax=Polypterus senegalus TaxID=55291 RepID=UPI00196289F6|nr:thioredoxin domain-containing protein 6-like [Polypterus senegalus]
MFFFFTLNRLFVMAGQKKEMVFQVPLTNQEQWDEMLSHKGVNVIDVYQQWCGLCKAAVGFFGKIKNDLGDDLLHFATV